MIRNYKDKNIKCINCDKTFIAKTRKAKYCSNKCYYNFWVKNRKDANEIKKRRARYYQKNKEKERASCKKWYLAHRESEIEKNREYRKQNRELFDWYHNKDRYDGKRNEILKRDENICKICKKENKLVIHHIDGDGYSQKEKGEISQINNDERNLITLCNSCHHKLHWWQRKNYNLKSSEDIVRTMMKIIEIGNKNQ